MTPERYIKKAACTISIVKIDKLQKIKPAIPLIFAALLGWAIYSGPLFLKFHPQ
jgi:hypothetical protein